MPTHTLGIDFGTTNSVVACWDGSRAVAVNHPSSGRFIMPSVVYYGPDQTLVGDDALQQLTDAYGLPDPEEQQAVYDCIVQSVKRRMVPGGIHILPHRDEGVPHEQIVADILRKLKTEAERLCLKGEQAERVVLTHPVAFLAPAKQVLRDAARLAGFAEVELMEEPVAAAIGYAAQATDKPEHVLIYDFGGGTFDTAYLVRDGESTYKVVDSDGDAECGGAALDVVRYDHFERLARNEHGVTLGGQPGRAEPRASSLCRRIKHRMSLPDVSSERFVNVVRNGTAQKTLRFAMDKPTFEGLARPLVDRSVLKVSRVLERIRSRGIKPAGLRVVLIGGSSELPIVARLITAVLPEGAVVEHTHVLSTAVALGAAARSAAAPPPTPQPPRPAPPRAPRAPPHHPAAHGDTDEGVLAG